MRNLFILGLIAIVFASCSTTGNGELIGVQNRPIWNPTDPYGMVFVPQGTFNMGPGDQDVPYAHVTQHKTVSVAAFYIDETEITNNEYRQFVTWVRDSIARVILGENGLEGYELIEEDEYGNFIEKYLKMKCIFQSTNVSIQDVNLIQGNIIIAMKMLILLEHLLEQIKQRVKKIGLFSLRSPKLTFSLIL
jgi:hypothetical protein